MLRAALASHFGWYNFRSVHRLLQVTSTMEAGITNSPWSLDRLLQEACL